jgi:hypothetical protein
MAYRCDSSTLRQMFWLMALVIILWADSLNISHCIKPQEFNIRGLRSCQTDASLWCGHRNM